MTGPANRLSETRVVPWSATSLRLHVTLVAGLTLCGFGSWVEWTRALDGHLLAWVYAFEWPLFAVLGTWVWWRLVHGQRPAGRPRRSTRRAPEIDADDPDLAAWQDYLARLQAMDPPGGPPD